MTFAPANTVAEMRDLLLKHGAQESADDADRWTLRKETDMHEHARLQAFFEDDRDLAPLTGGTGLPARAQGYGMFCESRVLFLVPLP